ncbi:hypothetical protein Cylst_6170 [Cylindrospermum stagnale PCC 7417]|uniref:Cas10/Cmr2 second palm domain-containing protein n=1 Tax=Cylindrospermum stagnale PCC 7417 TaxID=56107 RepID=K9X7U0_9NOST|nr:hypothetical protein [Cylindrospermum stagnale]AFZ28136.1 hypothetical protein Cylst_6170 [Cylindrospermum stagnale PCC 7417]
MSKYIVTILDSTGIQSYIFTSNRLRENIGASYLVEQATGNWVKDKLEELGVPKHRQNEPITNSGLIAELVYAGGGNAMLLFKSMEDAKRFTRHLSRHILEYAPGINLVAAHKEFDWNELLYDVVQNLMDNELEQQKRARVPSVPLLGLGITASCNSTQLVAVNTSADYIQADEEDIYLISSQTQAKLKAVSSKHGEPANKALKKYFGDILIEKNLQFPYRMDHLGRSQHESSYYAVIHADGNSMGKRFEACGEEGKKCNPQDPNRGYIDCMRNLSKTVKKAGLSAMQTVVQTLANSIENGELMGKFSIKDNYLPFRPLVYGGDDVTFVCDGRLGLELAAIYLEAFQEQKVADFKVLTACAGVCIVKSHYPFARAYEMSEALCSNAKKFLRKQEDKEFSAIDWHIASSGLFGSVGDIRQREYQVAEGDLTMRPVMMQNETNQWRTWSNFRNLVKNFNEDKEWKGRRNKVIGLREKLRDGQEATRQFLKAYRIDTLPPVKEVSDEIQTSGWVSDSDSENELLRCGYFDAIEAMEFYFPLNKGESGDCLQTEN